MQGAHALPLAQGTASDLRSSAMPSSFHSLRSEDEKMVKYHPPHPGSPSVVE